MLTMGVSAMKRGGKAGLVWSSEMALVRGSDGTIVREQGRRKRTPLEGTGFRGGQGWGIEMGRESRSCGGHQRMAMERGRSGRGDCQVTFLNLKAGSLSTPRGLYSRSLQTRIIHLKPRSYEYPRAIIRHGERQG